MKLSSGVFVCLLYVASLSEMSKSTKLASNFVSKGVEVNPREPKLDK